MEPGEQSTGQHLSIESKSAVWMTLKKKREREREPKSTMGGDGEHCVIPARAAAKETNHGSDVHPALQLFGSKATKGISQEAVFSNFIHCQNHFLLYLSH